jgi:hypothetical protein
MSNSASSLVNKEKCDDFIHQKIWNFKKSRRQNCVLKCVLNNLLEKFEIFGRTTQTGNELDFMGNSY